MGPASGPSPWIMGLDIGGTNTAVLAGTPAGGILERQVHAMVPGAPFADTWSAITALADRLVATRGRPSAIGVSVGGPLDTAGGVILSPPNLPGWDAVPVRDLLTARFGAPTFVEHDARAGALAEWLFGAARGCRDVVFLTFGTGMGAGLIVDGRLHRGAADAAGEVGRWRMAYRGPRAYGKTGSWEAFASGSGLPRLARFLHPEREWPPDLTAEAIVRLARSGDQQASRVVETAALWLGRGIAYLVDLLDPEIVVLGSIAVRAGDLFLPTAIRTVRRETGARTHGCRIVAAETGESLGDLAALSAAIYHRPDGAAS